MIFQKMKAEKGSVTIIAIVMLLFLFIVGIAWLPMLTAEKTGSALDYHEQQAWYAAEAGYKRATVQLVAKNNNWDWLTTNDALQKGDIQFNTLDLQATKTSDKQARYGVSIVDSNNNDLTTAPEAGKKYYIIAVGTFRDIQRVIKEDYTIEGTGGEGEEGDGTYDGLGEKDFMVSGGGFIYGNDKEVNDSGFIYDAASSSNPPSAGWLGSSYNENKYGTTSPGQLDKLKFVLDPSNFIGKNLQQYHSGTDLKGNYDITAVDWNYLKKMNGQEDFALFSKGDKVFYGLELSATKNCKIITDGTVQITDGMFNNVGTIYILAAGDIHLTNVTAQNVLIMANGNVKLVNCNLEQCFISAASVGSSGRVDSISISGSNIKHGQMQAKWDIRLNGGRNRVNFKYVLDKFKPFPKMM